MNAEVGAEQVERFIVELSEKLSLAAIGILFRNIVVTGDTTAITGLRLNDILFLNILAKQLFRKIVTLRTKVVHRYGMEGLQNIIGGPSPATSAPTDRLNTSRTATLDNVEIDLLEFLLL